MYINFQQNWVRSSVKNRAHKFICKNRSYTNLQLPIVIKKKITPDMHLRYRVSIQISENRAHKCICKQS